MTRVIKKRKFNIRKFTTFTILTLSLLIILPLVFQSVANGGTEVKFQTIYVENGDNLWNIAQNYTPKGEDVRSTIAKIKDFNKLEQSNLSPGQEIKIPTNL